jgi:virginiamycin B lyase
MRRSLLVAALALAIFVPTSVAKTGTAAPNPSCVVEIAIPGGPMGTIRTGLDVASDGMVWLTRLELNQIGKYDPTLGQFQFFTIPSPNTGPHSVAVDQSGDVWFTEINAHRIGVFHPGTGQFQEFPPPTPISMPYGMAVASNGDIWFTEMAAIKVGRYRPSTGLFKEFPLNPSLDSAANIALDEMTGVVWVTGLDTGNMIRLNPSTGAITRYDLPGTGAPHSASVDTSGRAWFTDIQNNAIGGLDPATGQIREFTIPTSNATSHGIAMDSRRLLVWFTELNGNKVGVLNPIRPRFIEGRVPTAGSKPYFISQAPDGEIWFTEGDAPNIGHLPCSAY